MKYKRSFVWRIGILFAFIAIMGSLSVSRPSVLPKNDFVKAFMGPDLVSVLVVALTITFASVANIHLTISRMIGSASNKDAAEKAARKVRSEINSNAWTIFWAFGVALTCLFVYGAYPKDETIRSLCITGCSAIIILNGLVMHDLYRSIFILVSSVTGAIARGEEDFGSDTPPTE
ncbi:hypothetical protein [Novosphingobium lindaniclasticum]